MSDLVRDITMTMALKNKPASQKIDEFQAGDTVGVYVKVREGEKERIQLYKGVCLKIQGSGMGRSFTVRKVSAGIGVERTFPFATPSLDRVELIARGQVRRARLYFLRGLKGKAAKLTSTLVGLRDENAVKATPAVTPPAAAPSSDSAEGAARPPAVAKS